MDLQGLAITSWFVPKDVRKFKSWVTALPIAVRSRKVNGSTVVRLIAHEASFPSERFDRRTMMPVDFDFTKELAAHVADGEYVNLMNVSNMGSESVHACSATVFSDGTVVSCNMLDELKSAVKEATGKDIEIEPYQKD